MIYPKWRQTLARNLSVQNLKPECKFFQVASIGLDAAVQNRTMVHRGFADETNNILAITDIRSEKSKEWRANTSAQLCWYFTDTREQFRISAMVTQLDYSCLSLNLENAEQRDQAIYENVWQSLSKRSKAQFNWPTPKADLQTNCQATNVPSPKVIDKHFVVVCFTPYELDYLNLTTSPQTREIHTLENTEWKYRYVNA